MVTQSVDPRSSALVGGLVGQIDSNAVDYDRRSALHLSACEGNVKVVEYMLLPMNKCQVDILDRWGISPLFDAITHG